MPCALCTPQILYRLSRSSYSNLNDPDPLPPQRFCIVSHSTYSNLKRLPAGEIAVQKIHQQSNICKERRSKILHNWLLQWVGTYTNVIRSIKRATCTRHKKHSWLQERTTSSRPMPRLPLNSLLNFPSVCCRVLLVQGEQFCIFLPYILWVLLF